MELYSMIKNVYGRDVERELIESIKVAKTSLEGLVEERMCKVYSSYVFRELKNRHIPARIISTIDLGLAYEHFFVLVPSDNKGYYLVDLTVSQFKFQSILENLKETGYQLVDDVSMCLYLNGISKDKTIDLITLDDIYYQTLNVPRKTK